MKKVLEIPKNLIKEKKLIIVPKRDYDEFLRWRKTIKFFTPTTAQKKDFIAARRDYKKGKFTTLHALKRELGRSSKR